MGDLVFNAAAGAMFGYQLLWVVVVGVVGIITYSEMCGRVAAVSKRAVFDAVRERLGFKVGLVVGEQIHAIVDFTRRKGFCRSNFPPASAIWGQREAWSDDLLELLS